jgi:hypothetical protein
MHPTADTSTFIFQQRCGAAGDAGRYAAVSPKGKCLTFGPDGSDVIAPRAGPGGSCAPHNKRMHATADTRAVKFLRGAGRRVMRGVGLLQCAFSGGLRRCHLSSNPNRVKKYTS